MHLALWLVIPVLQQSLTFRHLTFHSSSPDRERLAPGEPNRQAAPLTNRFNLDGPLDSVRIGRGFNGEH